MKRIALALFALLALCATAEAACPGGWTLISPGVCQRFFTTTGAGTVSIPADWSSTNKIEAVSGAGGGSMGDNTVPGSGAGGGGGEYCQLTNVGSTDIQAGDTLNISVGVGGAAAVALGNNGVSGGATLLQNRSASTILNSNGGAGGNKATNAPGLGGSGGASGTGTCVNGGAGGDGSNFRSGGAGGGGSGGPHGAGAAGGIGFVGPGSSGGGSDGGTAGTNSGTNDGATGGDGSTAGTGGPGGVYHFAGAVVGSPGTAVAGGGAGGGGGSSVADASGSPGCNSASGGAGGAGQNWDATHGVGGGGAGMGPPGVGCTTGGTAGVGGLYGGGGAGGGLDGSNVGPYVGSAGAQGILVVTYTQGAGTTPLFRTLMGVGQ